MENRTAFLLNPSARWKKKIPAFMQHVYTRLPCANGFFYVDRNEEGSLERHLEAVLRGRFDRIVAAGGDGTLNRTVNFLRREGALDRFALGLVPFGTCNDFARSLGYRSGGFHKPVQALVSGRLARVRVASVNQVGFINNAGFGKKHPTAKRHRPLDVLREMTPVDLEADWEAGSLRGSYFMLLAANAPYFSGGLYFSRKSNPQDGLLEFYFVRKGLKIRLALKLLFGRARLPMLPPFSRSVHRVQAPRLRLRTQQPVAIVVDGDPAPALAQVREALFQVRDACRFIVPASRRSPL